MFCTVPPVNEEPAGPCGPCGPVAPLSPFGPCAPVSPLSPLSPFVPFILTEEGTTSLVELVQLSTPEEETEGFQYLNVDCVPAPVEYATISPDALMFPP